MVVVVVLMMVGGGGDGGGAGGDGVDEKCGRDCVCCAVSCRGVMRCVFFSARDEKIHCVIMESTPSLMGEEVF